MTTFYVSTQHGNDANAGTSVGAALRTVLAGSGRLTSGGSDILWVGPGIYRDQVLWSTSGSRTGPHQILADWHGALFSQDTPGIVRITGANGNEIAARTTVFTIQASHLFFDRFILDGVQNTTNGAAILFDGTLRSNNGVKFSRCHFDPWIDPVSNFASVPIGAITGHWRGVEFEACSTGLTGGGKSSVYINGANFGASFYNTVIPGFCSENPEGHIFDVDAGSSILDVNHCFLGATREGSNTFRDNGFPLTATLQNCDVVLVPTAGLEFSGNEVSVRRSNNRFYGPGNAGTLQAGEVLGGTIPLPYPVERFNLYGARVFDVDRGTLKSDSYDIGGYPRVMGSATDIGVTEFVPYPFQDRTTFRTAAPAVRFGGAHVLWSANAAPHDFQVALNSGTLVVGQVYIQKNSPYGSASLPGIQHLGHPGLQSSNIVTIPDVNNAFQLASVGITPFMDTVVTFRIIARSTLLSAATWFDDFSVG